MPISIGSTDISMPPVSQVSSAPTRMAVRGSNDQATEALEGKYNWSDANNAPIAGEWS